MVAPSLVVAFALALGACGGSSAPAQEPGSTDTRTVKRPVTPRSELPPAIVPLLPKNGIYVAGGGFVSSPWRVVVDLDAQTIYGGSADTVNAPSFGPMDRESKKPLSPRNGSHLMKLAQAAWVEPPPKVPFDGSVDYDEIFVVLEGDETFYLQGFGPIRRPAAAQAIVELRAAAGL